MATSDAAVVGDIAGGTGYPSDEEPRSQCQNLPGRLPSSPPGPTASPPPSKDTPLDTSNANPGPLGMHVNLSSAGEDSAPGQWAASAAVHPGGTGGCRAPEEEEEQRRGTRRNDHDDVFRPSASPRHDGSPSHAASVPTRTVSEGANPAPARPRSTSRPQLASSHSSPPAHPHQSGRGRAHTYSGRGHRDYTRTPRTPPPPHYHHRHNPSSPAGVGMARRIRLKSLDGAAAAQQVSRGGQSAQQPSPLIATPLLPRPIPIMPNSNNTSMSQAVRAAAARGGSTWSMKGMKGRLPSLPYPIWAVLLTAGAYGLLVLNSTDPFVVGSSSNRAQPNLNNPLLRPNLRQNGPDLSDQWDGREVTFRGMGMALSEDRPWMLAVDDDAATVEAGEEQHRKGHQKERDGKSDVAGGIGDGRESSGQAAAATQQQQRHAAHVAAGLPIPKGIVKGINNIPALATAAALQTGTKRKKRRPRLAHARAAAVIQKALRPTVAGASSGLVEAGGGTSRNGREGPAAAAVSPGGQRHDERPRRVRRELPVFELSEEETATPSWRELYPKSASGRFIRAGFGLWQWLGMLTALVMAMVLGVVVAWGRFVGGGEGRLPS